MCYLRGLIEGRFGFVWIWTELYFVEESLMLYKHFLRCPSPFVSLPKTSKDTTTVALVWITLVGWFSFLKMHFSLLGVSGTEWSIYVWHYVETADGSDEEDEADGYYEAKASKKKEKKRQEREAQRRVHHYHLILYLFILCYAWTLGHCSLIHMILIKAEETVRESRHTKQDRYAEMRRRKDEEREAEERRLVCWLLSSLWHWCTQNPQT